MFLQKIKLVNFRNFQEKEINFDKENTLIIGKNSLGKTNILEAVYFLINGEGFRENKEEELIKIGEHQTEVNGSFLINESDYLFYSIKLQLKNQKINKKFYIEKTEKNYFLYQKEQTKTVLFSPEQLEIIIGSPQKRRDYINKTISLFDKDYKKKLNNYEQALKKRNKILESKIPFEKIIDELDFWDNYLIKEGDYLTKKRQEYIDFLNQNPEIDSKFFSIVYLKNNINEKRLQETFQESLKYKKTLVGPQKDDFQIMIDNKNIHKFGSRSEQRLAIFWLKVNEIKYIEKNQKIKPIILLDDIFSELDEKNQKIIFTIIKNYQTIASSIFDLDLSNSQKIYL